MWGLNLRSLPKVCKTIVMPGMYDLLDFVQEVTEAAASLKRALSSIFRLRRMRSLSSAGRVKTRCWYGTLGNWDKLADIQRSVANLPQDEQILDLQE